MKPRYALAIDIGGTNVKAGLVSATGKVLKFAEVPTEAERSAKRVVGNILCAAEQVADKRVRGAGVGCPGPLDLAGGTLHNRHRFPRMDGFNIKKALEHGLGRKIVLDNDANCFALGELVYGAARGKRNVLALTLGTGLGCGLVVDGRIYRGTTGMGAEIGISPYRKGMLEDYVAADGLLKAYRKAGGRKYRVARDIGMNAKHDATCRRAFKIYGQELALGITPFIDLLDPELIVLGGGIAKEYRYFRKPLDKELRKRIYFLPAKKLRVAKSKLRNRAGLLGAAVLGMPGMGRFIGGMPV